MINNGVLIQSVAFAQGQVEISYIEPRDAEKVVQKFTTLVIPIEALDELYDEMQDSIQQVVDKALEIMRAPADRIIARR